VSNRTRGDYFERQTRDVFTDAGWLVVRSAGSLGPADLVALRAGHPPVIVSCKISGRLSYAERAELADLADAAGAAPVLASRPVRGRLALASINPETLATTDYAHHRTRRPSKVPRREPRPPEAPIVPPGQTTIYQALGQPEPEPQPPG
jgi:Holliday junction resolvase